MDGERFVEVQGRHIILTLAVEQARDEQIKLKDALETLDQIYEGHKDLRGDRAPYHGQRIRFFGPDPTTYPKAMWAGNPIRMTAATTKTILKRASSRESMHALAHELGHTFTWVGDQIRRSKQELGFGESWPNLFVKKTLVDLDIYTGVKCDITTPDVNDIEWKRGQCFLLEFQSRCGWRFYETFFTKLNDRIGKTTSNSSTYIRDLFPVIVDELGCGPIDVSDLFIKWNEYVRMAATEGKEDRSFCHLTLNRKRVTGRWCGRCLPGYSSDDTTNEDVCAATLCTADQHVVSNVCEACPAGTTNAAGDDASSVDTACDIALCSTELKICPDGSGVGRTGPDCEFAPCPDEHAICTCPNGAPATGTACIGTLVNTQVDTTVCASCNAGFYLQGLACVRLSSGVWHPMINSDTNNEQVQTVDSETKLNRG